MKPILFNTAMIQAIIRREKTQTRRIMKVQPTKPTHQITTCMSTTGKNSQVGKHRWATVEGLNITDSDDVYFSCPYGEVDDLLWVRETWAAPFNEDDVKPSKLNNQLYVWYRANNHNKSEVYLRGKWRPSIFMPRWACRIVLKIDKVRVERIRDISEEDAKAEGVPATLRESYASGFERLWDSINFKRGYGWDKNPWVWVVDFSIQSGI